MFEALRQFFTRFTAEADNTTPPATVLPGWSDDDWWEGAQRADIHPGRLGGVIDPWAVVVHETQMHTSTFHALLRRVKKEKGPGSGFHFLVGRTPEEGVHQLAPIYRNANHAGAGVDPLTGRARPHGWFKVYKTADRGPAAPAEIVHPNRVAVGIELSGPGPVRFVNNQWRVVADGRPVGAPVPEAEVYEEAGRHWHAPTAYQIDALDDLLRGLRTRLRRPPGTAVGVVPNGRQPEWARGSNFGIREGGRAVVATHAELDPARKTDPSPRVCEWLRLQGWS